MQSRRWARHRGLQVVADEVFAITGKDPLLDVAVALEQAARADEVSAEGARTRRRGAGD